MDGELCGEWVECLPQLLGPDKTITLGNGEQLCLRPDCLKLLFETEGLEHITPACLLNTVRPYIHTFVTRTFRANWCIIPYTLICIYFLLCVYFPSPYHFDLHEKGFVYCTMTYVCSYVHKLPPGMFLQGLVYFDRNVLSWTAVFECWAVGRSSREITTLNKYLVNIMDHILDFVLIKAG